MIPKVGEIFIRKDGSGYRTVIVSIAMHPNIDSQVIIKHKYLDQRDFIRDDMQDFVYSKFLDTFLSQFEKKKAIKYNLPSWF